VRSDSESSQKTRFEAFSDGVFAIAITLLILEIRLPSQETIDRNGGLARALLLLWPSYVGYAISFVTVGIMWANHYNVMRLIVRIDFALIVWNLLLLMAISFTPFPTAVMAEYLPHAGHDRHLAVGFYCLAFSLTAVLYNLFWRHASRDRRLIDPAVGDAVVAEVSRAYWPGIVAYFTAAVLSFISVTLALAIVAGLDVFYMLPRRGAHVGHEEG
jgi:uncharacterized membrane protein